MCGFAGEFILRGGGRADLAVAGAMAARLAHRGPDEEGQYLSDDGRCAIGFRRLAVIDPPRSHQPLSLPGGRSVVAFNGEIYNYRRLRQELAADGVRFATEGDTEVLPALWERDGLAMLDRLDGMFAFAIHDARANRLLLARDRLGKKPLWYAQLDDRIVFASEAKALLAHPLLRPQVDPAAVGFYLCLGYVPAPRSIWRNIRKLPPAHSLLVEGGELTQRRYWALPRASEPMPTEQALERVRETVFLAVNQRLAADVPLGVLLSGGVDSSIVAALMAVAAATGGGAGVRTFTAGFDESGFDERPAASAVARHLGTRHTELLVRASDAAGLLDRLVRQYDEPFADSSALALYLVCQAARQHVTVALTGDGGDEAFAGYERYRAMDLAQRMGPAAWAATKLAAMLAALVAPQDERSRLRRLIRFASAMDEVPARQYFAYRRLFAPWQLQRMMTPDFYEQSRPGDVAEWFTRLYEAGDPEADDLDPGGEFEDEVAYAQRCDLLTYLPDDLLVKADIASMAHGLELRSPLLDHRVVALGLSLPLECRLRGRQGKAILRDAFAHLLPPEVFERRKSGFAVPIDRWLRDELGGLLRQTLLEGPLAQAGWFDPRVLEGIIDEHATGRMDHRHRLWALLWLGRWMMLG